MSTPDGRGHDLAAGVLAGEVSAIARSITLVERGDDRVPELLSALYSSAGRAHVIGVTGPAGSGKSTLVAALTATHRNRGRSVGIIAVDPSSSYTGGALLGDRIRMLGHSGDTAVFIRSMATRGAIGGLARAALDGVTILDAAGMDTVILETVGVGQSEVDVMSVAQSVAVVSVPGLGDSVQALKAGLLEIADVHVVNKSDREGSDRTVKELLEMLRLHHREAGQWNVPVLKTVAADGTGVAEFRDVLDEHRTWMQANGELARRDRRLTIARVKWASADLAARRLRAVPPKEFDAVVDRVLAREIDPLTAAGELHSDPPHAAPVTAAPQSLIHPSELEEGRSRR